MIRRYILISYDLVTDAVIEQCIQTSRETLRHVIFENDPTDWVVLKWRGDKPDELFNEFPVYSDQEMRELLLKDITKNTPE